jgi:hypothetical protein
MAPDKNPKDGKGVGEAIVRGVTEFVGNLPKKWQIVIGLLLVLVAGICAVIYVQNKDNHASSGSTTVDASRKNLENQNAGRDAKANDQNAGRDAKAIDQNVGRDAKVNELKDLKVNGPVIVDSPGAVIGDKPDDDAKALGESCLTLKADAELARTRAIANREAYQRVVARVTENAKTTAASAEQSWTEADKAHSSGIKLVSEVQWKPAGEIFRDVRGQFDQVARLFSQAQADRIPERVISIEITVRTKNEDKECGVFVIDVQRSGQSVKRMEFGDNEQWPDNSEKKFTVPADVPIGDDGLGVITKL